MKIPTAKILPNPEQPRSEIDPVYIASLAESLRQHGLINPIAVEEAGEHYILVDGECRWRAAVQAGWSEIEASVRPSKNGAGSQERLTLAMVANLQRQDMNPIDEAKAFERLRKMGLAQAEVAQIVGVAQSYVSLRLRMLGLEPEIQDLYARRKLPIYQPVIAALESLPDESRVRLTRGLAQRGASIKTIISICQRVASGKLGRGYTRQVEPPAVAGRWNMLKMVKHPVPDDLAIAARATCKACVLYDDAGPSTCSECPGVVLLNKYLERIG